ncbi:GTP 3',8-cyclase MoaA [Fundidesulfovibrio butyratiphilus]
MLADGHGRVVTYLRVSVTDRCNLRCLYCRPVRDFKEMPHFGLLSYEEHLHLIGLLVPQGLKKVRLTGGEPLTRRGFDRFLGRLADSWPNLDLRMTTNATLLPGHARRLAGLGLRAVNISLDSLRAETFRRITGCDLFDRARRAVDECLEAGLTVKINAVALKGINDAELPDFLQLATQAPLDVRFIEFMPIGLDTAWESSLYWSGQDILAQASRHVELVPEAETVADAGPARMWRIAGGLGRLGVISGISGHACAQCNRLRLTSDGRLRPCLYSDREYRLRPMLRNSKVSEASVERVIRAALARKPVGRDILMAKSTRAVCRKAMTAIGG